jgi:DNA-binding IclR family transcriptional regulator
MSTSTSAERRSSVVERVAAILMAFLTGEQHTMTELARITGLPVSTTHRLVCDLMATGILDRDSDGFRIGLPLRQLRSETAPWPILRHRGPRLLADLAAATKRRARLGILSGTVVEYIEHCPGSDGRADFDGAGLLPAHATAIGKALLAFAPRDRVAHVAQRLNTYTSATIDTPHKLHRALLAIRSTRIAVSRSELRVGLSAVATPVFGPGGCLLAAVELELRDESRELEVCQPALMVAAASLSRELSLSPSGHWSSDGGSAELSPTPMHEAMPDGTCRVPELGPSPDLQFMPRAHSR